MIDQEKFYRYGTILFGIVAVFGLFNYTYTFWNNTIFSAISSAAMVMFNFLLFGFFYYLYKTQASQVVPNAMLGLGDSSTAELEEALKNGGKKSRKRRT